MTQAITCQQCHGALTVADTMRGEQALCPQCQALSTAAAEQVCVGVPALAGLHDESAEAGTPAQDEPIHFGQLDWSWNHVKSGLGLMALGYFLAPMVFICGALLAEPGGMLAKMLQAPLDNVLCWLMLAAAVVSVISYWAGLMMCLAIADHKARRYVAGTCGFLVLGAIPAAGSLYFAAAHGLIRNWGIAGEIACVSLAACLLVSLWCSAMMRVAFVNRIAELLANEWLLKGAAVHKRLQQIWWINASVLITASVLYMGYHLHDLFFVIGAVTCVILCNLGLVVFLHQLLLLFCAFATLRQATTAKASENRP